MSFPINNMSFTYNIKKMIPLPLTVFINTRLNHIFYEIKMYDYLIKMNILTP
jgi:hypothetical protein